MVRFGPATRQVRDAPRERGTRRRESEGGRSESPQHQRDIGGLEHDPGTKVNPSRIRRRALHDDHALQALAQGLILLPFAPLAGASLDFVQAVEFIGAMALAALTFSAIGVGFACRFTSTTVFPIVSNAVLLPMFFMSGGLYSLKLAPPWMQVAAQFDPVAYAVDLMRGAVLGTYFFPVTRSLEALALTIILLVWAAVRVFNRGEDDSSLGAAKFNWRR